MILILGGVRSGKSRYAEKLATSSGGRVLYLATSKNEFGMEARIAEHRRRRPKHWGTLEKYRDFTASDFEGYDCVLLDCVGVMSTNLMFEVEDLEHCSEEALSESVWKEFESLLLQVKAVPELILVSNEIGSGLVSEYQIGNQFRDLLGTVNQRLAERADEVYFMVAGIPMKLKGDWASGKEEESE